MPVPVHKIAPCFALLLLLSLLLFLSPTARASIKPQVGMGYTDNVYLEDTQKNADFFWWTRVLGLHSYQKMTLGFLLYFRDQIRENPADRIQWKMNMGYPLSDQEKEGLKAELNFGQVRYPHGSPYSSETGFNNTFFGGALSSPFQLGPLDSEWEVYFQGINYSDTSQNRNDRIFGAQGSIEDFSGELGFLTSSDAYYSKTFFELAYDYYFSQNDMNQKKERWQPHLGVSLTYSFFPNRKLSETVRISNRKGNPRWATQVENETQMLLQISPSARKIYGDNEIEIAAQINSQNSRSRLANYSEFVVLASIQRFF